MSTQTEVTMDDLRELVADAAELDPAEITDDAAFGAELEVDSLTTLEITMRLEKKYGIKIAEDELLEVTSLASVRDLVAGKLAAAS
ncbi:acyl carrier protein [Actinokineospora sp. G85]|uniref:acyl carrier protein n=1 Tax=Actinokineospora sp. G85 TaxID=3406626 RepID=UPI003C76A4DA